MKRRDTTRGDGSANVVLVRNGVARESVGCSPMVKPGIRVLREAKSRWANARAIWNQHAYVATQICDGRDSVCAALGPKWGAHGMVPMDNVPAWSFVRPGEVHPYDAARANTSGPWEKTWGADAAISHVLVDRARCPMLVAKVRVVNHGQVPLRPGTRIVLRSGYGVVVGSTNTQRPLQPGSAQMLEAPIEGTSGEVTVIAEVDTDDRTAECREDNNTFGPVRLSCAE